MYMGSMSVEAPSTMRPKNNAARMTVHMADVLMCRLRAANERENHCFMDVTVRSKKESRANRMPTKNMKKSPEASMMFLSMRLPRPPVGLAML